MQGKQLYSSIEIANDEVRLLVGEYYMSRFNVLRSEAITIAQAINRNREIEKPQIVSAAIVKLLKNAEKALSLKIRKVILCIPSVDVKCVKKRVNVVIEEGSKRIMMSHVRMGLEKAIEKDDYESHEFVNVGSIKYIVGGISSRTAPLDEKADMLTMDVELIYANKEIVHSYVMCLEASGISVLEICLNTYAIAEESVTLENSMDKYIVLIDLQKGDTILSLYYKGRLLECERLKTGYQAWINELHRRHHLSYKEAEAIIMENAFESNGIYDDMTSYIWVDRGEQKSLTKKQIYDTVEERVKYWLSTVNETCEPLKDMEASKIVLSGRGADIVGLRSVLTHLVLPSQIYIPSTLGIREGRYTACLGSLYCTRKWLETKNQRDVSIEYNNLIAREIKKEDEVGFTKKLKSILQVK